MAKQTFGATISSLRKQKGMTQLDLAQQMGVTDKAVSKWERDLSFPDVASLPKLAEVLDVSADKLLAYSASGLPVSRSSSCRIATTRRSKGYEFPRHRTARSLTLCMRSGARKTVGLRSTSSSSQKLGDDAARIQAGAHTRSPFIDN